MVRCGDEYTLIVACHVYAAHGWPVKAFGDHVDPLGMEFNVQEVQPWEWKVVLDPADWRAYPVKAAISAHAAISKSGRVTDLCIDFFESAY